MRTQSKDEFKEAMRRAKEQAAEEKTVSEIKEPAKRGRKPKAEKEIIAKEIKKPAKKEAGDNPAIEIKEEPMAIDIKAISKAENNSEAVRAAIALMDTEIEKLKRQSQRYNDMALIYVGYRKTLEEIIQS